MKPFGVCTRRRCGSIAFRQDQVGQRCSTMVHDLQCEGSYQSVEAWEVCRGCDYPGGGHVRKGRRRKLCMSCGGSGWTLKRLS